MKFNEYDKERLIGYVANQYGTLAQSIGSKGRATAVSKIYQDVIVPRLEAWKKADPDFYGRLELCQYLVTEANETFEAPSPLPSLHGISDNGGYRYGRAQGKAFITEKMILDNLPDEAKTNGEKALQLRQSGERVKGLLKEYLKDFTNPAQLSFSFPQLHTMFCMQSGKQVKPQKRPKYFKQPSEELKTLVLQSMVLAQAQVRS